jgi:hypothetical protein
VEEVDLGGEPPFVYFRRTFHSLELSDPQAIDNLGPVVFELDMGWV